MSIAGIYCITCKKNNKLYIGSSITLNERITEHKRQLRNNCHFNKHLQRSYNKYGKDEFEFEILEVVDLCSIEELRILEGNYINELGSKSPRGFNISNDPLNGPRLFGKLNGMYGRTHNNAAREKISKAHKGRKLHESQKMNIANAMVGDKNHFYGKKHNEKTRIQMSKNHANVSLDKNPFYKMGKLTVDDVIKILGMLKDNKLSHSEIGKIFGVCRQIIQAISSGKIHKDVKR